MRNLRPPPPSSIPPDGSARWTYLRNFMALRGTRRVAWRIGKRFKHLVSVSFRSAGLEVRRASPSSLPRTMGVHNGYDLEDEAREAMRLVQKDTMLPDIRLLTLYQQTVYVETQNIPGSLVECGVWKGGAVGLMALTNLRTNSVRRHIHLFDSFDSIPEPNEKIDGPKALSEVRGAGGGTQGRLVPIRGFYSSPGPLAGVKNLLEDVIKYPPAYLHYHVGWFEHTVPAAAARIGNIALLRLDGDWYASTKVCLEYLYDHVVSGGFVVVDDYGRYDGCRQAVEEYRRAKNIVAYLHQIDGEGRYWIKP